MAIDVLARLAAWIDDGGHARSVKLGSRSGGGYLCHLRHATAAGPCTTTGRGATLEAAADDALMQEVGE